MRIPSGSVSQISRQSALDCSKSVSPTHRPPLTPQERFLVLISFKGCANSRPIPMTPSEIEPANFWLLVHRVAHYINEYIEYFYGLILDKNNMFPVIQHDFSVKSNCGLFFFSFLPADGSWFGFRNVLVHISKAKENIWCLYRLRKTSFFFKPFDLSWILL